MTRAGSGVAGLALALAAGAIPAHAADPYTIPAIMALTGQGSFAGKGEQVALQLAQKIVNATGGIRGRELVFDFHDDQTNPQVAVQLASEVLGDKPAVMIGGTITATCRAVAPLAKNGPVDYCLSPGIHPEKGDYVFSSGVSTLDLAQALVRYFRLKGWTRIALMVSSDATGQDAENGLKSVLAAAREQGHADRRHRAFQHHRRERRGADREHQGGEAECFIAWSTGNADRHHLPRHARPGIGRADRHHRRQHDLRADDAIRRLPAAASSTSPPDSGWCATTRRSRPRS